MLNLFCKKVIIAVFVFLAFNADAQIRGNYNFLDFANKSYYFGITLAYNNANYRLAHSENFILNDSLRIAESTRGAGFNLGIVTNLKIGQHFDFRFLPTLSFTDRNLQYFKVGDETNTPLNKRIESVFVEMPFHVRYKSAPYRDVRLFVIAGAKYSFDVASNSRARQAAQLVQIAPSDFAFEYGAGVQIFFPYFIFSPEIKISHGISNALIYNPELNFSNVIERILSRTVTISFHFEG